MSKSEDFWVIGIGASAGGLEALTAFFKSLKGKPNAAFVIAQHLAPHSKSMMVELLARQTKLPVIQIKDHLKLQPGIISIVPPNYDVTAQNGELRLQKAGPKPDPSLRWMYCLNHFQKFMETARLELFYLVREPMVLKEFGPLRRMEG